MIVSVSGERPRRERRPEVSLRMFRSEVKIYACAAVNAWWISERMSSILSIPTDRRTRSRRNSRSQLLFRGELLKARAYALGATFAIRVSLVMLLICRLYPFGVRV